VGHDVLLEANPRLIVCALTGYGQTGPLAGKAGHDLNYLGRSGLLGLQGPASGPPQIPAFQLADVSGGLWSVVAILAALRERDQNGHGKLIDISMLESVIPFATISLGRVLGGEVPERGNEILTGGIAVYDTYSTRDGETVTLGALEPKFMVEFCRGAGIEPDLRMLVPGVHQAELKRTFRELFESKTRAEWQKFSEAHDCCLEPVLKPEELRSDPQLSARGTFVDFETGEGAVGQYRTPITPRDLIPRAAPRQGEHTAEVLREAGFSAEEIEALRARSVIG
jgi:crotonobetainyl-CoA:carnitine CoA-transferase CaiB-like acyl-CoA transferase